MIDEDGFFRGRVGIEVFEDAIDDGKSFGWPGDDDDVGSVIGGGVDANGGAAGLVLLSSAVAAAPAIAASAAAPAGLKSREPPAAEEAEAGDVALLLLRVARCLIAEEVIDQPRRAGGAGVLELPHTHVRRIRQALIERRDDLNDAADVRRRVGHHQRVARLIGGEIRVADQRLKVLLELHRVGVFERNDLCDQLVTGGDFFRVRADPHRDV